MTFVECLLGESEAALYSAVQQAYASIHSENPPGLEFGQLITWEAKLFREVRLPGKLEARLMGEEAIFLGFTDRATLQMGSFQGMLFGTPPSPGAEVVARLNNHGRQSLLQPFIYETKT
jgi:hypothetical protein